MSYTIESAIAALQQGETTIQSIAKETGWPVVDECLVPEPRKWHAADQSGYDVTAECDSGEQAAQEYVDGGEWGEIVETTWITVAAWRKGIDADGDIVTVDQGRHKITLESEEPACIAGEEHDWQSPYSIVGGLKSNPGVHGNGGGVTIQEVCMRCGCGKLTDTWAQDRSDGQQGLTSVRYDAGKYEAEVEKIRMDEVREFVQSHDDEDSFEDDELVRLFKLAYNREPDDEDRGTGLWSLICAAVQL